MNILQTKHGQMMVRQGNDFITMHLAQKGEYEYQVVELCRLLALGQPKGCIVDIGANMGTVTCSLAKLFPHYKIYAYEPQRLVAYQLAGNVALNDLSNVYVRQMALDMEPGELEVAMPDYDKATNIGAYSLSTFVNAHGHEKQPEGVKEKVRVEKLDDQEFDGPVRLIKIDVEGMELGVLKGGRFLLDQYGYPPLVYESWPHYDWYKHHAKELEDFVTGLGYKTYTVGLTIVAVHPDGPKKINVSQTEQGTKFEIVDEL